MKEWLQHNQSWVINALTLIVAIGELTEVTSIIPQRYNGALAAIMASANLILRFATKWALGAYTPEARSAKKLDKIRRKSRQDNGE